MRLVDWEFPRWCEPAETWLIHPNKPPLLAEPRLLRNPWTHSFVMHVRFDSFSNITVYFKTREPRSKMHFCSRIIKQASCIQSFTRDPTTLAGPCHEYLQNHGAHPTEQLLSLISSSWQLQRCGHHLNEIYTISTKSYPLSSKSWINLHHKSVLESRNV